MTETRRATRTEELLFDRERQGIRTLMIVRGLFMLIVMSAAWIVGVSLFSKIATTAIALLVLVAIGVSLFLLAHRVAVGRVGLAGCVIDIAVLSTLPVIWYLSVGGSDVPPAFMLKTQITAVTANSGCSGPCPGTSALPPRADLRAASSAFPSIPSSVAAVASILDR